MQEELGVKCSILSNIDAEYPIEVGRKNFVADPVKC
jgi:hypothetical protein